MGALIRGGVLKRDNMVAKGKFFLCNSTESIVVSISINDLDRQRTG